MLNTATLMMVFPTMTKLPTLRATNWFLRICRVIARLWFSHLKIRSCKYNFYSWPSLYLSFCLSVSICISLFPYLSVVWPVQRWSDSRAQTFFSGDSRSPLSLALWTWEIAIIKVSNAQIATMIIVTIKCLVIITIISFITNPGQNHPDQRAFVLTFIMMMIFTWEQRRRGSGWRDSVWENRAGSGPAAGGWGGLSGGWRSEE